MPYIRSSLSTIKPSVEGKCKNRNDPKAETDSTYVVTEIAV